MGKVLIKDIAREMGLSRNTVAKALKGDSIVLESTRKRIITKAFEMGYGKLTEEAAKSIKDEKEAVIPSIKKYVILMNDYMADDFWNGVVIGISERINHANGSCLINFVSPQDEAGLILPANVLNNDISGIMCLTVFESAYAKKIEELNIPAVFLDSPVQKLSVRQKHDIIMIEGMQSIYEITVDLIQRGCKKLGFIGDITYCQSIYDRWIGYRQALAEYGVEFRPELCLIEARADRYYSDKTLDSELDALPDKPDALVCANDYIAIRVLQYCKRNNIAVPDQIAVTGFDNKKECMIIEPHITSVNTTNRRIGIKIAEQLLWRISNPTMHQEVVTIATEPYIRESSRRTV